MTVEDPAKSGRACWEGIEGPAPGSFLKTSHGNTHFVLLGNENDPLVILQHGLGSSTAVWDNIAENLLSLGFRVLRYDLYDRGYSETDQEKYPIETIGVHPLDFTVDVYVQQMRDVLTQLGLTDTPFVHCGHSLGGLISVCYSATYPEQVKGMVLVAAVCLPAQKPLTARVADLPIIGNLIAQKFGASAMVKFGEGSVRDQTDPTIRAFLNKQKRMVMENPRYFASIRSTNAHCLGFVGSAEDRYRKCCESKIPVHLIWGKADASVPYDSCLKLKAVAEEMRTSASELSFDEMPHNVFFPDAKPEECKESISDFCTKKLKG